MQASSPSWNANDDAGTGNNQDTTPYTSNLQPSSNGSSAGFAQQTNAGDRGLPSDGSLYEKAESDGDGTQTERTDAVEMVSLNKGTSRTDLKDAGDVRRNGSS